MHMHKKVQIQDHTAAEPLPRREQEVLDLVYRIGRASAREVQNALPDQPSYSATRMLLKRLHKRGLLDAERCGTKDIYQPVTPKQKAGTAAFNRLLQIFFDDSPAQAFSALLANERLDAREIEELEQLIAQAKRVQRSGREST